MLVIATSPDAIAPAGKVDSALVQVLNCFAVSGSPVGVFSNREQPAWFAAAFGSSSKVVFVRLQGRQNGEAIQNIASRLKLPPSNIIVLASKPEDVQMSKNGGAVLVAAGWSTDPQIRALGIRVENPADFAKVVELSDAWDGTWWFAGNTSSYSVRVLADLSTYGKSLTQAQFAAKTQHVAKQGGPGLTALLTITMRSLLGDGLDATPTIWGVYPSSASDNDDKEILSDFTHRLRTTASRAHHAKRGAPLFIRHVRSPKRHAGGGGDRTDPSSQLDTIHVNSAYSQSIRGKHAIIVDDCATYGVSFGVAAALLRKAGARSVTGVALGKFGEQLRGYDIEIIGDPFAPLQKSGYKVASYALLNGTRSASSQNRLVSLIP